MIIACDIVGVCAANLIGHYNNDKEVIFFWLFFFNLSVKTNDFDSSTVFAQCSRMQLGDPLGGKIALHGGRSLLEISGTICSDK